MATAKVLPGADYEQYHVYHAEAKTLTGELNHPIHQPVDFQGHVVLSPTRREGHITRTSAASSLEGLISFKAASTRASGNKIVKPILKDKDHSGWITLSTSVIEGLNVFEVITADRIVAQVSTEHPLIHGHVPHVTFLGSRFENLRIGGHPFEVELDLGICGPKPAGDTSYARDKFFLERVAQQNQMILSSNDIPDTFKADYKQKTESISTLLKEVDRPTGPAKIYCSLVKKITPIPADKLVPIPGLRICGHVIVIPDFGVVSLGEIEVCVEKVTEDFQDKRKTVPIKTLDPAYTTSFELKMVDMKLGCIGGGSATAATAKANGMTKP